jgi:membrane associated rhomboid family serine protease
MWQQHRRFGGGGMTPGGIGPLTRRLLFITVGIFVVQFLLWPRTGVADTSVGRVFGLSWHGVRTGMLWQLVTYSFLHGDFWHLFGNMLGLYFFGTEIEQRLGSRRFLLLYLGCGVLGGAGWLLLSAGAGAICIGASASVFGVLGTFAAFYPNRQITLLLFFVLPVTLTARTLILIAGGVSLLLLRSDAGGIAHAAHLAGGAAGYIYGLRMANDGAYGGRWSLDRAVWQLSRLFADWRAHLRRGRFRVMQDEADDAPVDWQEVDRILLKVRALGMGALTKRERDVLDRASRQVR